jgi:hypothetical protein
MMAIRFSPWDLALLGAVTAMGTLLAYIPDPRWKAFVLGLPIPFTLANLSLAQPVGPSHALGMGALLLFMNLVRWLHNGARLPIVAAIVLSEACYLGLAALLNGLVPRTQLAFWLCLGGVIAGGGAFLTLAPARQEPSARSPLPVAVKIVAIAGVISVIILLKQVLGGFMTMFPMVGTIAVYEGRRSLWTIGRQIPILMITAGPMMGAMWIAQQILGASVPLSLLAGWAVFLAVFVPVSLHHMRSRSVYSPG